MSVDDWLEVGSLSFSTGDVVRVELSMVVTGDDVACGLAGALPGEDEGKVDLLLTDWDTSEKKIEYSFPIRISYTLNLLDLILPLRQLMKGEDIIPVGC